MPLDALILAAAICFFAVLVLNGLAPRLGLIDIPTQRKNHQGETPLIGGIAFYLATLVACAWFYPLETYTIQLFLLSCGLIVLLGSLDDSKELGVGFRLGAQFVITCILIFGAGDYIHNLGNILNIGDIDLAYWGIAFTFVATLSLINAFNWSDGIDGLAGGLALNAFICMAILFQLQGNCECKELPIILIASIAPFLLFNLGLVPGPVAKVFLGDAGSMFIGLSIIWLFVLGTQGDHPAFRPVTAVWVVAIPLWDLTSTVYRRLISGRSPSSAGRDHFHHVLMSFGFSAKQALSIILLISALTSSIGLLGEFFLIPEYWMIAIYVALFFVYNYCLVLAEKSEANAESSGFNKESFS